MAKISSNKIFLDSLMSMKSLVQSLILVQSARCGGLLLTPVLGSVRKMIAQSLRPAQVVE